jgi:hypothetical protein
LDLGPLEIGDQLMETRPIGPHEEDAIPIPG